MKVGIDARFLTHPQPGGFKTYTNSVVYSLAEAGDDNEYILYTDRPSEIGRSLPSNFKVQPVTAPHAVLREQWVLPLTMRHDGVDLAHFPCNTAPIMSDIPIVVTIHDAIPFRTPKSKKASFSVRQRLLYSYWRTVMLRAARHATMVLTVSRHAMADVVVVLGVPANRVSVVRQAIHPCFFAPPQGTPPAGVESSMRFLLAFASPDGRKNHLATIAAHSLITPAHPDLRLVLVCSHRDALTAIGSDRHVITVGPVSPDELVWLYRNADALVFPSLDEGFGLPPLEAMACGTPVVASTRGALPEILGECAITVDATSPASIAEGIRLLLEDSELRRTMIQRGLEYVSAFSRESMGRALVRAYARALHSTKEVS